MTTRYSDAQLHDMAARRGVEGLGPRPKERKKRSQEESIMQRHCIKWWQVTCRSLGVPEILLFSIPNGGQRGPAAAAIFKAEGLRTGAPDLFLAVPRGGWHGLFLELKRREGVVSPQQEVFHELLSKQAYKVVVCRTANSVIDEITHYCGLPNYIV